MPPDPHPPAAIAAANLTAAELRQREQHEAAFRRAEKAFEGAGEALECLFRGKLYRPLTWDRYCRDRLRTSEDRAMQLRDAFAVLRILRGKPTTGRVFPTSERQCRLLAALSPEDVVRAWHRAVESAKGDQPTIAQIERAVEIVTGRPPGAVAGEISPELMAALPLLSPEARHRILEEFEEEAAAASDRQAKGKPALWERVDRWWERGVKMFVPRLNEETRTDLERVLERVRREVRG